MATARDYADEWDDLEQVLDDWKVALRGANKAPRTVHSYLESGRRIHAYLVDTGQPTDLPSITPAVLRTYFEHELGRGLSANTVARDYRHLRQLFRYAVMNELLEANPLDKVSPIETPETPVPVITDPQLKALLDTCKSKSFLDRRDEAIIRVLLDCGLRLSELLGMSLDDVDLETHILTVLGKGRRLRGVHYGDKTSTAIKAYLRVRRHHKYHEADSLWIGDRGPLKMSGVQQMLKRRALEAGIPPIHPHQLRHTFAHRWMMAGGNETDLMRLAGWQSRQMVERYGRSAADERAQESHRRLGLGDTV